MTGTSRFALAAAWVGAIALVSMNLPLGRPVNDDYWGLGALMEDGLLSSLAWYYTEFQGNVSSWFFILLHNLTWINGVGWWASAPGILVTLLILAGGTWGSLVFLGWRRPPGWEGWALLTIASVIAWLSMGSVVSPNGMTFVFYLPSTIVHVWPWCLALIALGLVVTPRGWGILGILGIGLLGLIAGSLGFVESLCLAAATAIVGLAAWRKPSEFPLAPPAAWAWVAGLTLGLGVQLASPATWKRGSVIGSDETLMTNVQAVERLFAQGDSILGSGFGQVLLGIMGSDAWARVLVPVAVAADLVLRPGLLAIVGVMGWWITRAPHQFLLTRASLSPRMFALLLVLIVCSVAYVSSGTLYAYAGRHVTGLALIVGLLVAGWSLYLAPWWAQHMHVLVGLAAISAIIIALLAIQQVRWGFERALAWDAAQEVNDSTISKGGVAGLVDVPLKAGLSQSGLRDHGGSGAYVQWVRRNLDRG